MSSWNRQPIKILSKPGYSQPKTQGTFIQKTKPATVVSAYYECTSRASLETYKERLRLFLSIPFHLVFFAEESMVDFIKECRQDHKEKTAIIPLSREEWVANIKYPESMWESQPDKDPEKELHSVDLYKLWYEKKEFVLTAIELNPFEHDDFLWLDAGIVREPEILPLIKDDFPNASRIPTDRMLLLQVQPFTQDDEKKYHTITGNFLKRDRIAAGLIAGSASSWHKWSAIYDETMNRYLEADLFIGKEQTIMTTMVLENKDLVSLISPPKNFGKKWFYSLIYLGVSDRRFKVLTSFAADTITSFKSISSIPIL